MPVKKILLPLIALVFTFSANAEVSIKGAMEGVHYEVIKPAQPTSAAAGKVEVLEFFWYGCPHCYRFEPYVKGWLKKKSENIIFKRVPSMLNPKWESHARAYYAAEVLGITDKIHEPFFIALHVEKKRIYKEKDVIDFIVNLGVDRKKFTNAYHSFGVSAKIQQSRKLGQAFNLTGVPSVVVNGKYLTSASHAGSYEGLVVLMNSLAENELKATSVADGTKK